MMRAALTLPALLLAFASTPAGGSAQGTNPFTLVVNTTTPTDVLPFFYAVDHGMFKAAGLNVKVQLAPSGSVSMLSVVGGAAQVGFVNTLTLTNARDKGMKLQLFAPGGEYNTNAPNARLLVLQDSPIRTAADLSGKTIAVTGLHDLLAISTTAWLDKHGADPSTVRFVEIPGPTMIAALKEKRVDAIAIYDPFASAAVGEGDRTIGKPFDGIAPQFLTAGWVAKASWLRSHQAVADAFAYVIREAAEYTNDHYDELIPFIAKYSKLPVSTLEGVAHQRVPAEVRAADVQPVIDAAARYEHLKHFEATAEIFGVQTTRKG